MKTTLEGKSIRPKVSDWVGKFTQEGWITRSGKFVPCDMEFGHELAAWLCLGGTQETAEKRTEALGWMRLSGHGDRMVGEPNKAQLNTLWDYCQKMGYDYEETLAGIERLTPNPT